MKSFILRKLIERFACYFRKWQFKKLLYNALVIVGFFLLWEVLAYFELINVQLLPPPHQLFQEVFVKNRLEFFKMGYAHKGAQFLILNSILATLFRVLFGITIGFCLGLLTGALISYFKVLKRIFLPLITICAPISPIAWIPFAMILFGVGNKPAIFVVIIGVFFLITIATVSSIENAEPIYVNTARTLGASRRQIMFLVILPSILPSLFLILRINLFAAWMSVLAAEMVGVSEGLGAMVMVGRALFNMKIIFVAMILIGITGYLLDHIFLFIQRHFLWWKKEANFG